MYEGKIIKLMALFVMKEADNGPYSAARDSHDEPDDSDTWCVEDGVGGIVYEALSTQTEAQLIAGLYNLEYGDTWDEIHDLFDALWAEVCG
jgi:hypothetical protein